MSELLDEFDDEFDDETVDLATLQRLAIVATPPAEAVPAPRLPLPPPPAPQPRPPTAFVGLTPSAANDGPSAPAPATPPTLPSPVPTGQPAPSAIPAGSAPNSSLAPHIALRRSSAALEHGGFRILDADDRTILAELPRPSRSALVQVVLFLLGIVPWIVDRALRASKPSGVVSVTLVDGAVGAGATRCDGDPAVVALAEHALLGL